MKLLLSEKIYSGRVVQLTVDTLEYSSGKKTIREVVEHPGGAVAVPFFPDGSLLLIQQYRHPLKGNVIELPAGKLDLNEDPLHCAQRELQEETGYESRQWTKLTAMLSTPGFCNEVLHIFLAENISLSAQGQALEEGEQTIQLLRLPMNTILQMIERREIVDGKTIVGIMMAQNKLYR